MAIPFLIGRNLSTKTRKAISSASPLLLISQPMVKLSWTKAFKLHIQTYENFRASPIFGPKHTTTYHHFDRPRQHLGVSDEYFSAQSAQRGSLLQHHTQYDEPISRNLPRGKRIITAVQRTYI